MDTRMDKTALIIAYYYPPTNNGGVQRPASFAKYLPLYGYRPIVITCQTPKARNSEKGILRVCDPGIELTTTGGIKSLVFRGIRKVLFKLGILPGYLYWWYKEVLKSVESVMDEYSPDIILATFPPQENLMIGMEISKRYNIPLILDFRDGMVFEALGVEPFLVKWRCRQLERQFVNRSAGVISVTDPITDYFNEYYPGCNTSTISNGFDPEEWVDIKKINLGDKINIVYTGRLSFSEQGRTIESLIKTIDSLNKDEKKRLCLHMVGDFSEQEKALIYNTLKPESVNFVGFVDRKMALQYQYSADLLLLVTSLGQRSVATGKLFEYLAAGRPIFALTEGTAAEDIINRTGNGICINPNDIEGIIRQLKKIINMYPNVDFYKPIPEEIAKYDRKLLTKQLADVFDQVLDGN